LIQNSGSSSRQENSSQVKLRESDKKEIRKKLRTNPKDLKVTKRADYPFKSGFQSSLTSLQLLGIQLSKIDSRLIPLTKLTTLNLSVNALRSIEAVSIFHIFHFFLCSSSLDREADQLLLNFIIFSYATSNVFCKH